MLDSIPYSYRVALLVAVMSLIAAIDWRRNRQNATKWKEYAFVIVAGVVGAAFGFFNDLVTSSISPEYFVLGKGLPGGEGLTLRAGFLGMKAGFSAGAIAGAICLYAATRRSSNPPLAFRNILSFLWRPVVLAIIAASALALAFRQHDPFDFFAQLDCAVDSEQIRRFLLVWWIHAGLYLGLLVALVWIIADIVRLRKRQFFDERGQIDHNQGAAR